MKFICFVTLITLISTSFQVTAGVFARSSLMSSLQFFRNPGADPDEMLTTLPKIEV